MSGAKHTPGPWIKEPGTNVIWSADEKGTPQIPITTAIHSKRPWHRKVDLEEVEANANLISAAPELLEALKVIVDSCKRYLEEQGPMSEEEMWDPDYVSPLTMARRAIAKAEAEAEAEGKAGDV